MTDASAGSGDPEVEETEQGDASDGDDEPEAAERDDTADQDDADRSDDRVRTWLIAVSVVATVALVAAVAVLLFGGDDGGDEGPREGQLVVDDDFERPDADDLGSGTEPEWSAASGEWGIRDGTAIIRTANPEGPRTIALVELGRRNGAVQARAEALARGWGLVFRYSGRFDYWILRAAPNLATYVIQRIQGGELTEYGGVGEVPVESGVEVRVEFVRTTIDVYVDGERARTIEVDWEDPGTLVGMLYEGDSSSDVAWEDFRAESFVLDEEADVTDGGNDGGNDAPSPRDTGSGT